MANVHHATLGSSATSPSSKWIRKDSSMDPIPREGTFEARLGRCMTVSSSRPLLRLGTLPYLTGQRRGLKSPC